jgi:hypothetical protein
MKEERHYLDTLQTIFLEKMIKKIDSGLWKDVYSGNTSRGLRDILEKGFYTPTQKDYLRTMRGDYIKSFCI